VTGTEPSSGAPRAAVITVSSSRARDGGADESGDALARMVDSLGATLAGRELLADEKGPIEASLRQWADVSGCDLILTTGGTGFSSNDVTPEATAAVIDRAAPGIAEAMRQASAPHTEHWMLSRAIAGIRGGTLIVNFPGNPKAVAETFGAIAPALPHAIALLRGESISHRPGAEEGGER
jgi:molybdopterin adenylyltransferase